MRGAEVIHYHVSSICLLSVEMKWVVTTLLGVGHFNLKNIKKAADDEKKKRF